MSLKVLKEWEESFAALMSNEAGMEIFEDFLMSEFSQENIQFWRACERYRRLPDSQLASEAEAIFQDYLAPGAPKMVNLDHGTSTQITAKMRSPDREIFENASRSVFRLMGSDSYKRFIKTDAFQLALGRR